MRLAQILLVALGVHFGATATVATELVMYRRAGCPWCQAWEREIGPIFGKTDIARRAPLRVVSLDEPHRPGEITLASPIRFTPSFVLASENREIARIEGYPGEDFFWGMLEKIMLRLPSMTRSDLSTLTQSQVPQSLFHEPASTSSARP